MSARSPRYRSEFLNQTAELSFLSPREDVLWPGAMTLGGNDLSPVNVERADGTTHDAQPACAMML